MAKPETPQPSPSGAQPVDPHVAKIAVPPSAERDALVERWFAESFHGSVVAQSTECYNIVRKSVDRLKKLLAD